MSRAVVIGITGPIRAGKGLTTSTLVRHLHPDRIQALIDDNPGFLEDGPPFLTEGRSGKPLAPTDPSKLIGSKIRRGTGALWSKLRPDQRVTLCMDYWNKCEHLNLASFGIPSWQADWAMDAFHVISQDAYLTADGRSRMIKDIVALQSKIDSDASLPPWIIVEGYNILEESWSPQALLRQLGFLVVLHATKALIMSRNPKGSPEANEAAWNKECAPYLAQLETMFPWLSGPEDDMKKEEDGNWHHVTMVNTTTGALSGLGLQVAQFSGPGTDGKSDESAMEIHTDGIVKQLIQRLKQGPCSASKRWSHFPGKNCYDGRGGTNVDLSEDNMNPKTMSLDEAKCLCEREGYAGFTYESAASRMWRLREIGSEDLFSANARFDVYALAPEAFMSWRHLAGKNCYDGHGGTNVDLRDDNRNAKIMSLDDAKSFCEREGYVGFTYEPSASRMWRLKEIGSEHEFSTSARFEVHFLAP